jgi:CubicO group peptidase (beta-lactamase class C family)
VVCVGFVEDGRFHTAYQAGDLDEIREWASISKTVVGLAAAIDVEAGRLSYEDPAGPEGSTLAHLLSHASGLGFEEGDRRRAPGERRVYSNYGIDLAALACHHDPSFWLAARVLRPLDLAASLEGRPCADVVGTTRDLTRLAVEWLAPTLWSRAARDRATTAFLPDLAGIVPGFGRFDPSPWGLGPEVHDGKRHWMGTWPPESYGHFGQSGSMFLLDPTTNLALVATSSEPFGPWASELWPTWVDEVRAMVLS